MWENGRMGKIVYHGSWSPKPPHEYDAYFHVGTEQSAQDRLFSAEGIPDGYGHFQAMHQYEVPEHLISKKMYADPHFGDTYHEITGGRNLPALPDESDRVLSYLNDHEDRGSTSYVIPSHLVHSGMVKHLGAQWVIDPDDIRNAPIVNAAMVMLGGKYDPTGLFLS